jgi:hypothetical protein
VDVILKNSDTQRGNTRCNDRRRSGGVDDEVKKETVLNACNMLRKKYREINKKKEESPLSL